MDEFDNNSFCSEVSFIMPQIFHISLNQFSDSNQEELKIMKNYNFIMLLFMSMPVTITIWNKCLLTYAHFLSEVICVENIEQYVDIRLSVG